MTTKVSREQAFSVLATNFSISPSESGYTLQISADGINFTDLFAVGANVTRMVTGVASGSYYKLSGNTDTDVIINWQSQCNDGQGGGGGVGPQGPQGAQGATGPQGATGAQGPAGEGGSGEGVIHLDSLPNEGEEGITYEYNGRLFRYETTPENWGRWIGAVENYVSNTALDDSAAKNLILAYSVIPSGTVLGDVYKLSTFLVRLVYDGSQILGYDNTGMTGTPVGQLSIGGYTSFGDVGAGDFVRVSWVNGQINFYIPSYKGLRNRADITANKTNWVAFDMDGENAYPIIDMGTSDTTEDFGIPTWNKEGIIIQKNGNVSISYKRINNNAYSNTIKLYTSERNNSWESWFIPTQGGTAGQVLTSAGNAEPQWATIIKAQQITSAAYEALATKDPNTLYLIVDE